MISCGSPFSRASPALFLKLNRDAIVNRRFRKGEIISREGAAPLAVSNHVPLKCVICASPTRLEFTILHGGL